MSFLSVPVCGRRVRAALLPMIFCLLTLGASGNSYYLDAAGGNDGNSGLSPGAAWQTIARLNTASLQSGDIILFNRGQIFYGELRPLVGGISFDAYGTGPKPVISGLTTLSAWAEEIGRAHV